jgi:hypothetical protein
MTPELKIAAKVPRHLPQLAKKKLLDIYNQLWIADSFPNELKEALVVPFLKPGKDPNLPTSYCFCKVMKKLVNNRLSYLLEEKGYLPNQSYCSEKQINGRCPHNS